MILKRVLIGLLMLLVVGAAHGQSRSTFDLREFDFEEPTFLEGNWDFYWEELISATNTLRNPKKQVHLPHDWAEEEINGQPLSSTGYATYTTRLLLPKDRPPLGVFIPHAFSSYKVIINDSLVWESGVVADNKEAYRAFRDPKVISLREFKTQTLDIIIQVANFDHHNGGLYFPLEVDLYDNLVRTLRTNQGVSLFLAGGFFITGIVLLAFSSVYKHLSLPIPFYAFFSLSMMYRLIGADYYPLHAMFNGFDFSLAICLEYMSAYSAALFGGLFIFFMYPKQTPAWVRWSYLSVSGAFMVTTLLTNSLFFTSILSYYLIFVLVYQAFFIAIILKAKKEKEPTSGYLIGTVVVIFIWTIFQTLSFMSITSELYELRVLLISSVIILCNLALFRTFVMRINLVKEAEADIEYQKSRNTMLSLISHEIKMPVATLQMNMEMIKRSSEKPEKFVKVKDKIVDLSLNAVDSIKRMLNDFIYFMSLDQSAKDALSFDYLKCFISNNWGVSLHAKAEVDTTKNMYSTDIVTFKYVMNTLLGNAEKFSRRSDEPVEIHIDGKSNELIIEVRDFGIGMSKEQLEKIGTEQAKIDKNQEITGMGFYLAKELAERLGHKLWVVSRGSEGTSVFVRIDAT